MARLRWKWVGLGSEQGECGVWLKFKVFAMALRKGLLQLQGLGGAAEGKKEADLLGSPLASLYGPLECLGGLKLRKPSLGQGRNFARWVKARIRIQLVLTSKLVLKLCQVLF